MKATVFACENSVPINICVFLRSSKELGKGFLLKTGLTLSKLRRVDKDEGRGGGGGTGPSCSAECELDVTWLLERESTILCRGGGGGGGEIFYNI